MRLRRDRGFTLIELLMVIAIIAIVTAITIPQFVASMRGNRLRAATRMIVMAGRYARSMAVLRQEEMAVVYDIPGGTIAIRPANSGASTADNPSGEDQDLTAADLAGDEAAFFDGEIDSADVHLTGAAELKRSLDRVSIEYVDIGDVDGAQLDGSCTILYSNSGRCTEHVIRIRDEFNAVVTIEVDALSTVETFDG